MNKKTLILAGFILLKFILQYLFISPDYELHRDEYLHLDQASHLAWGYVSVPPFTSWNALLIKLLGNSVFWIKFFPALYGALTIYVVWKTVEELGGDLFALVLSATCVLLSALLRLNILFQPNSFDVLSWTALYFIIIKYTRTGNTNWLYIGAVVFAFGFLNKYNIIFLLAGMLPAFLLTPQRKIFTRPKLYLAALLALLLILPNIIWQLNNHFPVVHHMKELAETQLAHVNRMDFLKAQLLFYIGGIIAIFASFYALLFYKPFANYRLFFFSFVLTLLVFIYFRAKDYYAMGVYPVYIAFGSVFLAEKLKTGWKRYLRIVLIIIPILLSIPVFKVAFPNKSPEYIVQHPDKYKKFGMLRWEDGQEHLLPQDFADMLGWKELAHKVDSLYQTLPNKERTLILCNNYGQAGAINYYTRQPIKAVTLNADYINWFNLDDPYENMIRVVEAEDKQVEFEKAAPYFQSSTAADSITNPYAREYGTTIFSFTGAKFDIRERIKQEIEKKKNFR